MLYEGPFYSNLVYNKKHSAKNILIQHFQRKISKQSDYLFHTFYANAQVYAQPYQSSFFFVNIGFALIEQLLNYLFYHLLPTSNYSLFILIGLVIILFALFYWLLYESYQAIALVNGKFVELKRFFRVPVLHIFFKMFQYIAMMFFRVLLFVLIFTSILCLIMFFITMSPSVFDAWVFFLAVFSVIGLVAVVVSIIISSASSQYYYFWMLATEKVYFKEPINVDRLMKKSSIMVTILTGSNFNQEFNRNVHLFRRGSNMFITRIMVHIFHYQLISMLSNMAEEVIESEERQKASKGIKSVVSR